MSLFDRADRLLRDALQVTAHARADNALGIRPGDTFPATFAVENVGLGELSGTHSRTVFNTVTLRIEATPFATPLEDGEPVAAITIAFEQLIFGEAASREIMMRATVALDGPEPFARVHAHGVLDLPRFFSAGAVHQFTTDIRRAPATDEAADAFLATLQASEPIGGHFQVQAWSFGMDDEVAFVDVVDEPTRFRAFVRERVMELCEAMGRSAVAVADEVRAIDDLYIDVHESYTGAVAFTMWFMGLDQGDWVSFADVHPLVERYLSGHVGHEDRLALRVFKGFDNEDTLCRPVTVPDLPVVVNYGARTITLWSARLKD